MKIGVTVSIDNENQSLFTNGILQNAIYLVKTLKAAGHDAYLTHIGNLKAPFEGKVKWDLNETPMYSYADCYKTTDILFYLGATLRDSDSLAFKSTGEHKKIIRYVCGNSYIIDAEASIFDRSELPKYKNSAKTTGYGQVIDEVWLIPQQEKLNKEYLRVLYNVPADKVKVVPFIWDPMFIDKACDPFNDPTIKENLEGLEGKAFPMYIPGKHNSNKSIGCFEPNINIIKFSMIPTLIVNDYLDDAGEFKNLNVFCGKSLIEQKYYPSVVQHTSIFKNDPLQISYLPRIPIVLGLSKIDIVIAHQWENPLNYSYLDALYLNFPLVHNSPYIKDAGYYYPDFNIGEGKIQLEKAMNKHDRFLDDYNTRSEDVLTRYTVYNEDMLDLYNKLLDNAINPNTHELSGKYDWKTNTYL
jgi:hypothetical protein